MGWRFRKSFSIGGTRINFSKSGVGFSYKFLGFGPRITHMANGRTRKTYSIKGTGLSYVTETSGGRKSTKRRQSTTTSIGAPKGAEYYDEKIIKSSVDKSATAEEFRELNEFVKNARLKNGWIIAGIVVFGLLSFGVWLFLLPLIAMIFLKVKINDYSAVEVECPEMDDGSENEKLQLVKKAINSRRIRGVFKTAFVVDARYASGATSSLGFKPCSKIKKLPFPFVFKGKDEIDRAKFENRLIGIKIGSEKAIFLADFLLYDNGKELLFLDYKDIKVELKATRFVEEKSVPADSKVVDYTYKYVNNDGTPDRRFSYNPRIPICLYGDMIISSPKGLNMIINFSDSSVFDGYCKNDAESKYSPKDPVVRKAVKISIEKNKFSTALLQTYLGEGHNFVTGLAIWLEEKGVIGKAEGNNKPRKMLVSSMAEFDDLFKDKSAKGKK